MDAIKLYLDEDIFRILAPILRSHDYDVLSVYDVEMTGKTDRKQLEWAAAQDRVIVSFNVRHYADLAETFYNEGKTHAGILVSPQIGFSDLLRLILNVLSKSKSDDLRNTFQWLQGWR